VDSFTVAAVTATFTLRVTDHTRSAGARVNVRQVPGGNTVVIDLGGPEPERLKGTVTLPTAADEAALVGLRGQQGTLIYAEAPAPDGRQAILLPTERTAYLPGGKRQVRVEWILLNTEAP
jgi:hypothetical protein